MAYGFTVNVDGNAIESMNKIGAAIQQASDKVVSETRHMSESLDQLGENARKVGEYLAGAFAIREIARFGTELLHLTAEFEGFDNVIKYASKNAYDGAQNLDYVASAASRLHLPIKEAMESFSEMEAGFYGTGIEGNKLRNVFEGVSTAATVLHLSANKFGNVTFALKEIGELGTLQARQMRMLAFAMPGAMNLAAKAMHMNTVQFHEAMKHGAINSSEFLPAFAAALQEHFQKGLPNAGNSLISQMNDTNNELIKMKLEMGENLRPLFVEIMKGIRDAFDSAPIKWFVANIKPIAEILIELTKMWVEYKIGVIAAELAMKAWAVGTALVKGMQAAFLEMETAAWAAELAEEGLTVATQGFSTALVETGVGAFAVALGYLIEQFMDLNKQIDEAADKITNLKAVQSGDAGFNTAYDRIQKAMSNPNLTKEEKSEVLGDIGSLMRQIQGNIDKIVIPSINASEKDIAEHYKKYKHGRLSRNQEEPIEQAAIKEMGILANEQGVIKNLKAIAASLAAQGIKVGKDGAPAGLEGDASKTSHLAGAQGGLGEAKVINIHIGVMQQNTGVKESHEKAEQAIDILTRTLNNIVYGSSSAQ